MTDHRPTHVLFICNSNAARSVMAEALLNDLAPERFRAFSAGSRPTPDGAIDPRTEQALEEAGIATARLRSKSWSEFGAAGAPHMDLIVTLCDEAAGETCPVWPGQPATAHWSYADPRSDHSAQDPQAFVHALHAIRRHVDLLINLPEEGVDRLVLETEARRWSTLG